MKTLRKGTHFPFRQMSLSHTELNIAFYMAFLLLEPRIRAARTILNYESHVKFKFKEEGCTEDMYDTQFLRNIRRGEKNTLPSKLDKRRALLLPLLIYNQVSSGVPWMTTVLYVLRLSSSLWEF